MQQTIFFLFSKNASHFASLFKPKIEVPILGNDKFGGHLYDYCGDICCLQELESKPTVRPNLHLQPTLTYLTGSVTFM